MGAVKEMIGELGAAGYVPVDGEMMRRWQRATGTKIVTNRVTVEVRGSKVVERGLPASEARRLAADERLPEADRENLRWLMEVAGLDDDACEITKWLRQRAYRNAVTAVRLAKEAVEAKAAGSDFSDEWHRLDAYADCGEPEADAVMRTARVHAERIAVERGLEIDWYWNREVTR
jgi:hypothetical protein